MAYTVKKLAELSSVSVRTLHFYDQIRLLAPAYVGENGYRYYEEEQILMLQQILFFKELGFELKQVQSIVSQPDFNKIQALITHKEALQHKAQRTQELLQTIDKTIRRLKGDTTMKDNEMYEGFSPERQEEHEQYLINRYGDKVRKFVDESKARTKDWTKADWDKSFAQWDRICSDLNKLMLSQASLDSVKVQAVIKTHYEGIRKFWTPDYDSYVALTKGYVEFEWKEAFEKYDATHPRLAKFLADAAEVFAKKNLS